MDQRSSFAILVDDKVAQWNRPPSWWNLLILLPVLAMLAWGITSATTSSRIAERQRIVNGTIDSHDPSNHDRYGYKFLVDGKQYTGWAYPSSNIDYSVGERISVFYDPINPTQNMPSSFGVLTSGDLMFFPFCLLILGGLPLFIFLRRRAAVQTK